MVFISRCAFGILILSQLAGSARAFESDFQLSETLRKTRKEIRAKRGEGRVSTGAEQRKLAQKFFLQKKIATLCKYDQEDSSRNCRTEALQSVERFMATCSGESCWQTEKALVDMCGNASSAVRSNCVNEAKALSERLTSVRLDLKAANLDGQTSPLDKGFAPEKNVIDDQAYRESLAIERLADKPDPNDESFARVKVKE